MATEKVNTVRVYYGPRVVEKAAPSKPRNEGVTEQLIVPINYDDLPGVDVDDAVILAIPAGAYIKSAVLLVKEDFVGGTSYDIGLAQPDGTEIDADGLFDGVLTAALVEGAAIESTGALVGTIVPEMAQVTVVETGTFTAGKAVMVVEYQVA